MGGPMTRPSTVMPERPTPRKSLQLCSGAVRDASFRSSSMGWYQPARRYFNPSCAGMVMKTSMLPLPDCSSTEVFARNWSSGYTSTTSFMPVSASNSLRCGSMATCHGCLLRSTRSCVPLNCCQLNWAASLVVVSANARNPAIIPKAQPRRAATMRPPPFGWETAWGTGEMFRANWDPEYGIASTDGPRNQEGAASGEAMYVPGHDALIGKRRRRPGWASSVGTDEGSGGYLPSVSAIIRFMSAAALLAAVRTSPP